jgi:D-xylose transport system substrate-binding protein
MKKVLSMFVVIVLLIGIITGCTKSQGTATAPAAKEKIKIGLSLATMQEEKWDRVRINMENKAKQLGVDLVYQAANGDEKLQYSQCENLITQGVDALIVVAQDSSAASAIVDAAHEAKIPVVAHDRLIMNSDLDFYATFDCYVVGKIQGQYALDHAPTGNYFVISGNPVDNNAVLMRNGQLEILKPAIDRGDIKVVVDQWCKGWDPQEALRYAEDGLTANNNNVVCVLTSNDGTAGGAIQALAAQGLSSKVVVTGLDAELSALQRIVEGTQSMTVYRRFILLDETAVDVAVMLAKSEDPSSKYKITKTNNGKIDVPSILLDDTEYMFAATPAEMQVIIDDGWLPEVDIYKNVKR